MVTATKFELGSQLYEGEGISIGHSHMVKQSCH